MLGLTAHGGNRVLVAIANALVDAGHQCLVLTPKQPASMPFKFDPRVEVRQVGPAMANKPVRWMLFVIYLAWALPGRDVIANHFVTAVAARIAQLTGRTRVIYLVQDIEYRFYQGVLRSLAHALCNWTYRLPVLLPGNPYLENELRNLGFTPIAALKLGADRIFFEQQAANGSKQFDVVYFLRRDRHKRLDRFLQIASRLRQAGATIAGITQNAALLAESAAAVTATFKPESDRELIEVLDRCRLLLLTSDHEGFALPPLEAMARGLPCVIFPCGGPGVYAQNGHNCVVITDQSVESAAGEILRLLEDHAAYQRLSINARSTAAQFNFDLALAEIIPRLADLLPEPAPAAC